MEILIPKFSGEKFDAVYGMEEMSRKKIEQILAMKKNLSQYYILVVTFNDQVSGALRIRFVLSNHKPPPMLGTVLYHVDNRKGTLTREWVLPKDRPVPEELLGSAVDCEGGKLSGWNIEDDAKRLNMPILLS